MNQGKYEDVWMDEASSGSCLDVWDMIDTCLMYTLSQHVPVCGPAAHIATTHSTHTLLS